MDSPFEDHFQVDKKLAAEAAKKILDFYHDDPSRWTKDAYARDKDGKSCLQWAPEAVCWCLDGARAVLHLSYGTRSGRTQVMGPAFHLSRRITELTDRNGLVGLNDQKGSTFETVQSVLGQIAGKA